MLPKTGYEYLLDKFIVAQSFDKHKTFWWLKSVDLNNSEYSIYLTRGGYVDMPYGAVRTAGSGNNSWNDTAFANIDEAYEVSVGGIILPVSNGMRYFGFTVRSCFKQPSALPNPKLVGPQSRPSDRRRSTG